MFEALGGVIELCWFRKTWLLPTQLAIGFVRHLVSGNRKMGGFAGIGSEVMIVVSQRLDHLLYAAGLVQRFEFKRISSVEACNL